MTGMTFRDDFDRRLSDWLEETAGSSSPDYLDETLARVELIGQRPAWLSPGRWLPMRVLTPQRLEVPRFAPYLVAFVLLALVALAIALSSGSQRRLPPPFGPAAAGSFVYDSGGDLYLVTAAGDVSRLTETPNRREFGALWSRDGTRIAFLAVDDGASFASLWVAEQDGSGAVRLSGDLDLEPSTPMPQLTWSPDGGRLAFVAERQVHVVDADGSDLRVLGDGSVFAGEPTWSPQGDLLAFPGHEGPTGEDAVYVIDVASGGVTRVSQTAGGFIALVPAWAPDGLRLAYHANPNNEDIFVAELGDDGWSERAIVDDVAIDAWPTWSNDGSRISFVRSDETDHGHIAIVDADGGNLRLLDSGTIGWAPHCWSPDDRHIIAVTAQEGFAIGDEADPGFLVLSVDGTDAPVTIPTPGRHAFAACSWERRAP